MNVVFSTKEKAAIAAEARKMMASDSHHETAISFLREHGFDKLESTNALIHAGVPPARSKRTVRLSPVWQDVPSNHEALPHAVKQTVCYMGKTETSG